MASQADVLLMTPDAGVASAVAAALQTNGHVLAAPAARDMRELMLQLGRKSTSVVLVDVDPQPRHMLPHLERVIERYPATRFIALTGNAPQELLLEAMQTGIRRVVLKGAIRSELQSVLNRMSSAGGGAQAERGEIITILPAGGGCGATTLAINLADELGLQKQGQRVLLVDLDVHYGAVATFLGVEANYSIEHVLSHEGQIDTSLITSTATTYSERLHLLASPVSTDFSHPAAPDYHRLDYVLDMARLAYPWIIVDAPRVSMDTAAVLANVSTMTLLCFQLNVKDIRTAKAMLDALAERGVAATSITALAMRHARRHMISLEDASGALGGVPVQYIRGDFAAASEAMNFGKMLSEAAPRSIVRRDISDLAGRIAAAVQSQAKAE